MRTSGPSESRRRGGTRPGLAKVCQTDLGDGVQSLTPIEYIDSAGVQRRDLVYAASDGTIGYVRGGVKTVVTAELEDFNAAVELLRTIIKLQDQLDGQTKQRHKQELHELLEE